MIDIPSRPVVEKFDTDYCKEVMAIGPFAFTDRPEKPCETGCGGVSRGRYCTECRRVRQNALSKAYKAAKRLKGRT